MRKTEDIIGEIMGAGQLNNCTPEVSRQRIIDDILDYSVDEAKGNRQVFQDIITDSQKIRKGIEAAVVQPVREIEFIDFGKRKESPIYERIEQFVITPPVVPPIVPQKITQDIVDRINESIINKGDDSSKLNLKNVNPNYRVIITDAKDDFPFLLNKDMLDGVQKATAEMASPAEKSLEVFNYIQRNVHYGTRRRNVGYRNSEEVLRQGEGVCGEMAYLYVTLARSVGLESNYVEVLVDNTGNKVYHACANVRLNGKSILVDPAYFTYGIHHRNYRILTDREAVGLFKQWRGR